MLYYKTIGVASFGLSIVGQSDFWFDYFVAYVHGRNVQNMKAPKQK